MPAKTLAAQCTFCGKDRSAIESLIAGAGVFICNECVDVCNQILARDDPGPSSVLNATTMSDEEILDLLPQIAGVATQVEDGLTEWVRELRSRGVSWARIGAALGMARQSAWERFSGEE